MKSPKVRAYPSGHVRSVSDQVAAGAVLARPLNPSIEEQIAQLKAAGWIPLTRTCWKAPAGSGCAGCFLGPHGAWKAMMRGKERV
jgi:hypothetical protein